MDLRLKDKIVLVTGGSRGIGRETALAFAREGAHVAIAARGRANLDATTAELAALGVRTIGIEVDLLETAGAARAVAETVGSLGGLDILICNAGQSFGEAYLSQSSAEDWEKTYRFDVVNAVMALQAAVPHMEARGGGSAVFVSSISGRMPHTSRAQYAAAKAGMTHAARSLAWELGAKRIRVNAVSPGSTLFPGGGWERRQREMPDVFNDFASREFPWKALGNPQDVAAAIVFVASPKGNGINGVEVAVDAGQRRPSID